MRKKVATFSVLKLKGYNLFIFISFIFIKTFTVLALINKQKCAI